MRSIAPSLSLVVCSIALGCAGRAGAQSVPELPQPSPKARVEQRVGLSDVTIDYSSPAVKGRKIWGELVPYDRPWRTGANAATKLSVSGSFNFGGKAVPAGSYALYTIPGKSTWTVALNSSTEAWGNDGYDAKKDVVRVQVTPAASGARERLTFLFSNTTDSSTQIDLEWEKLRVSVPLTVDTNAQALANISAAVESGWRPYWSSARYLLDNGGDLDKALQFIDQSIAIKPNWMNHWVRAQLLEKKGRAQEAVATAEKTVQLGSGDRTFESFYKADVTKSLSGWKKKL